ncbi:MAG: DUF736 family protein [Verrucomicrobiales bacterium]
MSKVGVGQRSGKIIEIELRHPSIGTVPLILRASSRSGNNAPSLLAYWKPSPQGEETEVGAAWSKETKRDGNQGGRPYYSLSLDWLTAPDGVLYLRIFPNVDKDTGNPDGTYDVVWNRPEPRGATTTGNTGTRPQAGHPGRPGDTPADDDDIPF